MNALISTNEQAVYISSWSGSLPVVTELGYRVADVAQTPFEVAPQLFWVECGDDVVADNHYYDPNTKTINVKPADAPRIQPASTGTKPA